MTVENIGQDVVVLNVLAHVSMVEVESYQIQKIQYSAECRYEACLYQDPVPKFETQNMMRPENAAVE